MMITKFKLYENKNTYYAYFDTSDESDIYYVINSLKDRKFTIKIYQYLGFIVISYISSGTPDFINRIFNKLPNYKFSKKWKEITETELRQKLDQNKFGL